MGLWLTALLSPVEQTIEDGLIIRGMTQEKQLTLQCLLPHPPPGRDQTVQGTTLNLWLEYGDSVWCYCFLLCPLNLIACKWPISSPLSTKHARNTFSNWLMWKRFVRIFSLHLNATINSGAIGTMVNPFRTKISFPKIIGKFVCQVYSKILFQISSQQTKEEHPHTFYSEGPLQAQFLCYWKLLPSHGQSLTLCWVTWRLFALLTELSGCTGC